MASISCVYAVDIAVAPAEKLFYHCHSCIELIFILEGSGFVCSGDKKTPYSENQVIICQSGVQHADNASCNGMQFCVGLEGVPAEYLPYGVWSCTPEIKDTMHLLHSKISAPPGRLRSFDMDILAGYLAWQMKNTFPQTDCRQLAEPENDICEITKRELDAHIDAPYTLDLLASKVFVSKGYLRKLFKEKYGESPLSYLLRRKLDYAEELLRITDLPVQEISRRVGIDNAFYFSTMFTRKRGVSPSKYREEYKKSAN